MYRPLFCWCGLNTIAYHFEMGKSPNETALSCIGGVMLLHHYPARKPPLVAL